MNEIIETIKQGKSVIEVQPGGWDVEVHYATTTVTKAMNIKTQSTAEFIAKVNLVYTCTKMGQPMGAQIRHLVTDKIVTVTMTPEEKVEFVRSIS